MCEQYLVALLVCARVQQLRNDLGPGSPHDRDPVLRRQLDQVAERFDAELPPVIRHRVPHRGQQLLPGLDHLAERLLDARQFRDRALGLLELAHLLRVEEARLRVADLANSGSRRSAKSA